MEDEDYAKKLAHAYADFIYQHKWDWWCHLTFPGTPSRDHALKAVRAWIHGLNRKIFGKNYYKRAQGVQLVRANELQERGIYHFHLLIAGCEELHIKNDGVARWEKISRDTKRLGHSARIQVYDHSLGRLAAEYISKHAAAGAVFFEGPWPKLDLAEISQLGAMH